MASGHGASLRALDRIFNRGSLVGLDERQLLDRFAEGDEGAFEALVSRHGPMVLGVCRRLLYEARDVEDAFQATFLVLLRRAGGLRDGRPLGPWLHGVAYRVSARIRSRSARRSSRESRGARPEAVAVPCQLEQRELRETLDEEIGRLPEQYRRAIVLCDLEDRSHEEAAHQLRCSTGSLRGRLDRGRRKLRDRLIRRGVAPAAAIGTLASLEAASAAVPMPMAVATVATLGRAATASAVSGGISASAVEAANAVFRGMLLARVKVAAWLVVGVVAMAGLPMVIALEAGDSPRPGPQKAVAPARKEIVITGRVVDGERRPIVGARLALGRDFRGMVHIPEAVTGADGTFRLADVPAGPQVLTVQAAGHAPDLKAITAAPDLAPIEFRLGPGHTIRGRVVDAHDKPIAGAPISADAWRGNNSLRWRTTTDGEGRFRWSDAPDDPFMINLGRLGFEAERFWKVTPDAPEEKIVMRRPLHVRGRVTDAETGRPITTFTVVPGYTWENFGENWWENDKAHQIHGLSYDVLLSTSYQIRVIRIEAEGYLPEVSRQIRDTEEDVVVHLALKRGEGVSGVLRRADGSAAGGVRVVVTTEAHPVQVTNGRILPWTNHPRIVETRADGRFALGPHEPPYTILALDRNAGYAWQEVRGVPDRPAELTLKPWSSVSGTLRIGNHPGAGRRLMLIHGRTPYMPPSFRWTEISQANEDGQFGFDFVFPGEVLIGASIAIGPVSSGGGGPTARVTVKAGETTDVTLGGTGRPVVGKAVLAPELAARKDRVFGFCDLTRKYTDAELKIPPAFRPPVENREFLVELDGSFRIEDVTPGTYDMLILVNQRDPGREGPGNDTIGTARRVVVVPPIPGGRSDEPLDLGEILVTAGKE